MQQLFWHLTHLAFNHVLTAPQCLTDYVVELLHSQDHWQDQTTEIFHLEGTSGGHLNQLSSLSQPNFRTKNPVKPLPFRKGDFLIFFFSLAVFHPKWWFPSFLFLGNFVYLHQHRTKYSCPCKRQSFKSLWETAVVHLPWLCRQSVINFFCLF